MRRITRFLLVIMLMLYLPVTQAETAAGNSSKTKRLRFKDGPVCMCSTGLSEKDIQDALLKRRLEGEPGPLQTIKTDDKNQSNVKEEK